MPTLNHALRTLVLLAVAALATACKAKVGDSCQAGQAACQDDKTALNCNNGAMMAVPCKGAKGCKVDANTVSCDMSGNANGDPCSSDSEGTADCTADGKGKLECKAGKLVAGKCLGPDGCKDEGKTVVCDMSIANVGDECSSLSGGNYACAADKKSVLECKAGKFAEKEKCDHGACKTQGNAVGCLD